MTGHELLSKLLVMSPQELETKVELHDLSEGKWHDEFNIAFEHGQIAVDFATDK